MTGYRLLPDSFPDRSQMSPWPGKVHVSTVYGLDGFSTAEWESEERTRYLNEFGREVTEARSNVDRLATRR